jgi:membrane fusion protein, epimerase transport system
VSTPISNLEGLLKAPPEADPEQTARRIIRNGFIVLAAGVVLIALWTMLAPLTGAIIAPGLVKVDLNRRVVQHRDGGIVKSVLVRDGQRVRMGEPLILLEDVRADAQLQVLRKALDAESARIARLEAERAFPAALAFPKELVARRSDAAVADILDREAMLYRTKREALEGQIALLKRQVREVQQEAAALNDQIGAEERSIKWQKEELEANKDLLKQNFVQKTRVLTLERAVAEYESRRDEHRAELAKALQRTSETELRMLGMMASHRQQAADELKNSVSKMQELEERLRPSEDDRARTVIAAPASGEIVNLQVFTPGAVVGPKDLLAEVIPDEKKLIVEFRIRTEDINYVKLGTPADVRLLPYKQRTTPLLHGKVTYVSGDRLVEPQQPQVQYYTGHIEITPEALKDSGDLKLGAGMPAEVYVRTDSRNTLDYMLAPVTNYLRRGMREPL